jgi:hypothetical protein
MKKTILFLDDMQSRRDEFLTAFNNAIGDTKDDYEVIFAESAHEAGEKVVANTPLFAMYLDHDLTVEFFRPDVPTGMALVKNLIGSVYLDLQEIHGMAKPTIFLHSWNEDGRNAMYEALKPHYKVFRGMEDLKNREIWKMNPLDLFRQVGAI